MNDRSGIFGFEPQKQFEYKFENRYLPYLFIFGINQIMFFADR